MAHPEELHRREFTRQCLGGLGAASLGGPLITRADEPPPPALPEDPSAPRSMPPSVELLLLTALIESYPSEHYTDDILRGIYRDIAADQARGKQLRAFLLKNHDEPASVFRVLSAPFPVAEGTP